MFESFCLTRRTKLTACKVSRSNTLNAMRRPREPRYEFLNKGSARLCAHNREDWR